MSIPSSPRPAPRPDAPTLGLCLGAGGARGLAHVVVLETLDEMGLRPAAISGASMGAAIGACAAAGLSGRDLRAHLLALARDRAGTLARALAARADRSAAGWFGALGRPFLADGERVLAQFWPRATPATFEELKIPLVVVATDFYARAPAVFERGALAPAVAGSMAIPGLMRAVEHEGRVLVDGALTAPAPYEPLLGRAAVTIVCDVIGGPTAHGGAPGRFEPLLYSAQIMQAALLGERLATRPPQVLLRPPVDAFGALDFFAAARVLRAAETQKDDWKRAIEAALNAAAKRTP